MAELTTITADGQVTIPKDVRDALEFTPDEPIEIEWTGGDEVVIRKPRRELLDEDAFEAELARLEAIAAKYRDPRNGQGTDEYMAEIREPVPSPRPDDV